MYPNKRTHSTRFLLPRVSRFCSGADFYPSRLLPPRARSDRAFCSFRSVINRLGILGVRVCESCVDSFKKIHSARLGEGERNKQSQITNLYTAASKPGHKRGGGRKARKANTRGRESGSSVIYVLNMGQHRRAAHRLTKRGGKFRKARFPREGRVNPNCTVFLVSVGMDKSRFGDYCSVVSPYLSTENAIKVQQTK